MQKAKLTSTALWGTRSRKAIAGTHKARSFVRRWQKTPEAARIVRDARGFGFEMRVAAINAVGPSVTRAASGQWARQGRTRCPSFHPAECRLRTPLVGNQGANSGKSTIIGGLCEQFGLFASTGRNIANNRFTFPQVTWMH